MIEDDAIELLYPLPPEIYKLYTDDNIQKGTTPKPPMVVSGQYKSFGVSCDTNETLIKSLESQGIQSLKQDLNGLLKFTHLDDRRDLVKLNRSILFNFLDLLSIISHDPTDEAKFEKVEQLRLMFINFHHIINELRPIQAFESVGIFLSKQLQIYRDEIVQVKKAIEESEQSLEKIKNMINELCQQFTSAQQDIH
ncbi:Mediator of RNA polymerase II transcription subunit 7 [Thelohanellus kitauei]|uniref:Mediator of RNA polymerase II transcription subunit 7 n=1 Tax=Thelohanellus kitauei TaxID=669202 RepID=A0A0C2MVX8_THEKT|nr:Mediator of RNA polymerase II transcription subunit 7 [Thelohanellus kitauei]